MSMKYYDKSTDIESKIAFCTGRKKHTKWPTKENTGLYTITPLSAFALCVCFKQMLKYFSSV